MTGNAFSNTLTDVPGFTVGHAQDMEAVTGCTVILCPPGTVGGVDQRGGAPGTRETDLLHPGHLVNQVHAVMLAGGSAFGLAAAEGVVRWLEEHGQGYPTASGPVPIVPAAILFDLDIGRADRRPDAAMGYAACQAANDGPVEQGSVGAGTGAKIGQMLGPAMACKGGIGSASIDLGDGLVVGAVVAVNALGDVVDADGSTIAGVRQAPDSAAFLGAMNVLRMGPRTAPALTKPGTQTVIGVVATNAALSKEEINKVAQMAQNGLAMAVRPAHTMFDGDTIFALASNEVAGNVTLVGAYAAEMVAQAIRNAVHAATTLGGVRAMRDLR